jgi:hypothetical protein
MQKEVALDDGDRDAAASRRIGEKFLTNSDEMISKLNLETFLI